MDSKNYMCARRDNGFMEKNSLEVAAKLKGHLGGFVWVCACVNANYLVLILRLYYTVPYMYM